MMERKQLYELLTTTLDDYSVVLRSTDLEIFAYEMSLLPAGFSHDPGLKWEFDQLVPEKLGSLQEAFGFAVNFIEKELVTLPHVEALQVVLSDLKQAAEGCTPDGPLKKW